MASNVPKILGAVTGAGTVAVAGLLFLFAMLLSMNGFSERDSNWGLRAFILFSILTGFVAALAGWWLVGAFIRKGMSAVAAVLLGGLLLVISFSTAEVIWAITGVVISEFVRNLR